MACHRIRSRESGSFRIPSKCYIQFSTLFRNPLILPRIKHRVMGHVSKAFILGVFQDSLQTSKAHTEVIQSRFLRSTFPSPHEQDSGTVRRELHSLGRKYENVTNIEPLLDTLTSKDRKRYEKAVQRNRSRIELQATLGHGDYRGRVTTAFGRQYDAAQVGVYRRR